jgi:hypothetical protein
VFFATGLVQAADEVTQNVDVGRKFTTLLGDVYRDLYELSREFPDVTLAKLNEAGMLVEGLAKATRDNISKLLLQQTYTKYKGSVEMVSAVNSVRIECLFITLGDESLGKLPLRVERRPWLCFYADIYCAGVSGKGAF